MLKDYLQEKNISMYRLSKESGVPYATVHSLADGQRDLSRYLYGSVVAVADVLGLSVSQLEEIVNGLPAEPKLELSVKEKNRELIAEVRYNGHIRTIDLCRANPVTSFYRTDMALHYLETFGLNREQDEQCPSEFWDSSMVLMKEDQPCLWFILNDAGYISYIADRLVAKGVFPAYIEQSGTAAWKDWLSQMFFTEVKASRHHGTYFTGFNRTIWAKQILSPLTYKDINTNTDVEHILSGKEKAYEHNR